MPEPTDTTPRHPGLDVHAVVRRDTFRLDAALSVAPGEILAVLGPSGAGKSTLLRAIAGLERLTAGFIAIGGRIVDDADRIRLSPRERQVGYVPQDYVLFPRMTVLDNVAFGLRAHGVRKAAARRRAQQLLDRFGVGALAHRRPTEISGGQAQRVALARALAVDPTVLLLDEPLAALDIGTRMSVRAELREMLTTFPGGVIVVTHDPMDAFVLADHLVVMESGRVVQRGAPAAVASHPRTEYVARLCGINLHRGVCDGRVIRLGTGMEWQVVDAPVGDVFVAVRPSAVAVYRERPDGSPRNCWKARVTSVEEYGHVVRLGVSRPANMIADITAESLALLRLRVGDDAWFAVKATDLVVYPAAEGSPYHPAESGAQPSDGATGLGV
ncbi:ABC transporter related protein [Acidothermus cellulolyticus 11B]|uniref:ABC-type quaternary amine transporter n=1 Tax=Acidothermus cellulolyticus (strain ATCC 43068 / DSM 8971 / 11B) TaxID=351607 RepID=A0LWK0_ACIC1|nr:ABC transporter ATP-binding protein [Acidothermus cellulolyticus]ABK53810.1 ABC transporter related protein [Acidothermus cellulolyticus 11B]